MTNKEYLTATLSRFGLTETDVNLIILNQDINEVGNVSVPEMKAALYSEFTSIIPLADVSEGGYSIKWNMEAIKLWYSQLANELGRDNILDGLSADEINDASWRW